MKTRATQASKCAKHTTPVFSEERDAHSTRKRVVGTNSVPPAVRSTVSSGESSGLALELRLELSEAVCGHRPSIGSPVVLEDEQEGVAAGDMACGERELSGGGGAKFVR